MTDGQIIACLFIVCGGAIGGAAAYCLRINVPITLVNESDVDWGEENRHDKRNEEVAA